MSGGLRRVVGPKSEPDTAPDPNTTAELNDAKRQTPANNHTPTALLHDHREKTELRLIEELDQARDKNDHLVDELRTIERNHATLRERHRAMKSQRSSSTVCAGIGATLLGTAGMATLTESTKLIMFGIGASVSAVAILLDFRGCVETWFLPEDDGSKKSN